MARKKVWKRPGTIYHERDKLYLLDDDGKLYLFKIEKNSATLVSSKVILNATEAWGPMAIAGKYLIMRDSRNLLCLNIGAKTE